MFYNKKNFQFSSWDFYKLLLMCLKFNVYDTPKHGSKNKENLFFSRTL